VTADDLTVLDLLDALLRIDSVNPGLDPGGPSDRSDQRQRGVDR
jgi:hypothetical protein